MDDFAAIRATLLEHLPQFPTGGIVSVSEEGLEVIEPGVSIGDLSRLLADLTGSTDFLPEKLPVSDIRLKSLQLTRRAGGGADLNFSLLWDNASLAVADTFPLKLAEVDFSQHEGWMRAVAKAKFALDDYELDVTFELPSQVLELRVDPAALPVGTTEFLAKRGLIRTNGNTLSKPLTVREFLMRGSLPFLDTWARSTLRACE